jgi:hypothetical protein
MLGSSQSPEQNYKPFSESLSKMLVVVILLDLLILLLTNRPDRFPIEFLLIVLSVLVAFFEISRYRSSGRKAKLHSSRFRFNQV